MPRSSKPQGKTRFFGVRVSDEIAERVEAIRDRLQEQTPYTDVTTADVLRKIIEEGSKGAAETISTNLSKPKTSPKRAKPTSSKRGAKNA